jgi:hypothetical protein
MNQITPTHDLSKVNLAEYVEAYLELGRMKNHDLAVQIGDTMCAQGYNDHGDFDGLVATIEEQLPYYV